MFNLSSIGLTDNPSFNSGIFFFILLFCTKRRYENEYNFPFI